MYRPITALISIASASLAISSSSAFAESVSTSWFDGDSETVNVISNDSILYPSKSTLVEYSDWDYHAKYILAFEQTTTVDSTEQVKHIWDFHSSIALGSAANLVAGVGSLKGNAGMMAFNLMLDDANTKKWKAVNTRWREVYDPGLAIFKIVPFPSGVDVNQQLMDLARDGAQHFMSSGIDCRFMEKRKGLVGLFTGKETHTAGIFRSYDNLGAAVYLSNCPIKTGMSNQVSISAYRILEGHALYERYPQHVLVSVVWDSKFDLTNQEKLQPSPVQAMVNNVRSTLDKDWFLMYTLPGSVSRVIERDGRVLALPLPRTPFSDG